MRVRSPFKAMGPMLFALIATWFIYVPIHELLHVAGCLVTGGSVTTLQIKPIYFGHWLAQVFDFVEAGGGYAGRLSDFDWRGSDLIYLATDIGPFLLTIILGVPLLRLCTRRRRPLMFGSAVVVGLAPFYNIPGDYFEMGSIMVTRLTTWLTGATEIAYAGIRSDDIFTLIGKLLFAPAEIGLHSAGEIAIGVILTLVSLDVAIVLAFLTYMLGNIVATIIIGPGCLPEYKRTKGKPRTS